MFNGKLKKEEENLDIEADLCQKGVDESSFSPFWLFLF